MTGESVCPVRFHPMDPTDAANPFDALATLTATCPVSRQSHERFADITLVTSYAGVTEVYDREHHGDFGVAGGHVARGRQGGDAFGGAKVILGLDGDEHRRLRRIVAKALSPRLVDSMSPFVADLAREVVDAIPDIGRADLREVWATQIPSRAITRMIGVPDEDHDQFFKWTMNKMAVLAAITQQRATDELIASFKAQEAEFAAYMQAQLQLRRVADDPPHDVLTNLIALVEESDEEWTDADIIANGVFLLNAGNQTTANLLTNLVHQLISSGEWSRVRADRALVPIAIEESLRLTPPIMVAVRPPTMPTTIGGVEVDAGEQIVLSHLGANRDPAAWGDDAAEFKLERDAAVKHVGFAMGPHSCVGSAVARRVGAIAMNALLDRFERLDLAPGWAWTRQEYWSSLGVTSLEVVW